MRLISTLTLLAVLLIPSSVALAEEKRTVDGDVRVIHELAQKTETGCLDLDDHGVAVVMCTKELDNRHVEISMKTSVRPFGAIGPACSHLEVRYVTGSRGTYETTEVCPEGAPPIGLQAWDIFEETLWIMVNMLRANQRSI